MHKLQNKTAGVVKEASNPWIQIRGLNASFAKSIQTEIEKDALTDLSRLFPQYLKYWDQLSKSHPKDIKPPAGAHKVEEIPKAAASFDFSGPQAPNPTEPINKFSFPTPSASSDPVAPLQVPFKFPEFAVKEELPIVFQEEKKPPLSGFSFQSATPATRAETKSGFNFSFGAPQPMATPFGLLSPGQSQSQTSKDNEEAGADDEPLQPAQIGLIRTGAGEEGEECVAEARVKLFVFNKDDNSWIDLGVGFFKVNKRTDGATNEKPNRILCRSEVSGTVLLNSAIMKDATKADLEPGKNIIKLTCINQEGKLATYSVRTKEAQIAKSLVNAVSSLL